MALEPALKNIARWIKSTLCNYAESQGWNREDYRVLIRFNADWGKVHVILAARAIDGERRGDAWSDVMSYLAKSYKKDDPRLKMSLSLSVFPFDEIESGGEHTVSPQFIDIDEFLGGGAVGPTSGSPSSLNIG